MYENEPQPAKNRSWGFFVHPLLRYFLIFFCRLVVNFTRKWPESAGLMLIITTLLCIKWKMKSLQFSMLPRLSMETMEKAAELLIQDQQYLKGTWWLHGRKTLPMPSYLITSESHYRDMVSQSSIRSLKKMLESGQISRIWKKWRATKNNVKNI